ncbi:MAG TPA: folate-binding protein, partial [Burkholderiales bacterium]|nr:folate-binding protein [Burkholderiales bacterium]
TEMEVRAFDGAGQAIGLIGDNVLLALRGENAPAVWDALARWGQPYPTAEWDLRMIEAGLPMVTAATQDQFVPQMLNLEKLGAVSFDKGCYPGQEIVARSQYRGEVKRRLFRLRLPQGRVAPGEEIFADGIAQSAGSVINAAAQGEGAALLAVLRLEAVDRPLHLRTPDGPVLVRVP